MIICCTCKKQYEFIPFKSSLELPILVCPHCGSRHTISFEPTKDKSFFVPTQLRLSAAKPVLIATRILDADRTPLAADNADYTVTKSLKPNLIYVVQLDEEKGPWPSTYKLQWKNTTDGGSFADLAATGQINYSATTSLTNGTAVTARSCTTAGASGSTWQNGEEVEGASTSDSINLADEYYTEVHFAINVSSALADKTYDFQVIESGGGTAIGGFASSIIIAKTTVTKTPQIDSLLNKTGLTKTPNIDALLNKTELTKTPQINALLNKADLTKTSNLDSYLQKEYSKTPGLDGLLKKELTKTLGIDAGLAYYVHDVAITWAESTTYTKTISIDSLLNKVGLTQSSSIDSLLNKVGLTQSSSIDALLTKTIILSGTACDLFSDGAESGDLTAWTGNSGAGVTTTDPHSGTYAIDCKDENDYVYKNVGTRSEVYIDYWWKPAAGWTGTAGSVIEVLKDNSPQDLLFFYADTNGIYHYTGSDYKAGAVDVFNAGQWNHIQWYLTIDNTVGRSVVWVNGNNVIDFTGDTKSSYVDFNIVRFGKSDTFSNSDGWCYIDDVCINSELPSGSKIDAYLQKTYTKTISIDALLNKLDLTKTHSIDSLLNKIDLTQTSNIDSLLNKVGLTASSSIDSLLNKVGLTQSSNIDSLLQKLYTKSSSIDGILIKPPSVVLNTEDGYRFDANTTPSLEFTGTDFEEDGLKYHIQIATDVNFNNIIIDKNSVDDIGFEAA